MKITKKYCQRFIILGLTICLTLITSGFQCGLKNDKNMQTLKNIELKVDYKLKDGDSIIIKYEVTNNSKTDIFLLNKGDTLSEAKSQAVYIEPQTDDAVEIYRGGMPNAATPDRSPSFPITYGITKLAPKETFKEEFTVKLPLEPYSPFRQYTNNPTKMPDTVKEIRFCLGLIQEPKIKTKTEGFLVLKNYTDIIKQKLLCRKNFTL